MTALLLRRAGPSMRLAAAWIVVGSLTLGGLTSVAQGFLPDTLRSFANSPSGWTLLTIVMISTARLDLLSAALLGAVSFVCLVIGYTVVSELRGLSYSPVFWSAVGLVAGPAVGWSTSAAFHRRPLVSAVGSSLIAGVAITDAVYGLTLVADTTSSVYWSIAGLVGAMFLVLVALRRRNRWRFFAMQVGLTLVWVAIGSAGYAVLNGIVNAG
jgi:hypothetical protein